MLYGRFKTTKKNFLIDQLKVNYFELVKIFTEKCSTDNQATNHRIIIYSIFLQINRI